ncbi:MAG: EamA family transporter RarD [Bdellovibrionaceae bacterium]|nr:EamA family transporter RarD [Pseudobdellovibrionaceae bacterium]
MAIFFLIFSYVLWGLFPIYWKQLLHIPPIEVLCHRILWSFLFYGLTLFFMNFSSREKVQKIRSHLKLDPKLWGKLFLSSLMITSNWFLYIYAVNTDQILQGSLAYYISPLISVIVGNVFFHEFMPPRVRWALGFCGLGVLLLMFLPTILHHHPPHPPWLALSLAFSFFGYGFLKKSMPTPAVVSSFVEGLFFVLPSIYYIFWSPYSSLPNYTSHDWFLFVCGGIVTGLPLVFFSYAAQRLPFSTIGFFQYLSPTLQLMTAVFIYHEDFSLPKKAAFSFIWIGVGLYVSYLLSRRANISK